MAGILSLEFESPQTARTVALIPVPCLLGGVALDRFRRLLAEKLPSSGKYLFGLAALPLMAFVFQQNYDIYFNRQMKRGDTWSEFSGRDTAVARFMATLGEHDICYNNNATTRQSSYLLPKKVYSHRDFFSFRDLPPLEPVRVDQRVVYVLEDWQPRCPSGCGSISSPRGDSNRRPIRMENPSSLPLLSAEERSKIGAAYRQDSGNTIVKEPVLAVKFASASHPSLRGIGSVGAARDFQSTSIWKR
jgi:hypothetical protein